MTLSSLLLGGSYVGMTSFFTVAFLMVFLPACILLYTLMPGRAKKYVLLGASYGFYWLISGKLVVCLFLSTLSVHYFGLWLDRIHRQRDEAVRAAEKPERKAIKHAYLLRSRYVLLFAALLHIGTLLTLKYGSFFIRNVNFLLEHMGLSLHLAIPKYLLPIGISFFTMQAVSYLFDVYRETIKPDENLFRLGLFMSFFPQIVEGPICRYSQTAEQLWNVKGITFSNLTLGLQRILFGMMKKLVVADRLNPLVETVFTGYQHYQGGIIARSAVCYTVQLYMDFSGSMDAVMGTAQIFGITMPENFARPFFSKTISEFWKRWHITLGAWFKDYIFYPVTMSKPMKNLTSAARKKIGNHFGPLLAGSVALFCVWFCNGLWHGAAWSYIFYGMYHFTLILAGNVIAPCVQWTNKKLHINPEWFGYRLFQILRSCILVVIGELFFRAEGLRNGLAMFRRMVTDFRFSSLNQELLDGLGVDTQDFIIVGITLLIVLLISILNEKGIQVRAALQKRHVVVRWAVLYGLILYIVIFGAYGPGYIPVDPIYANF